MLDGTIIRGTTPEHEFELPYPIELVSDFRVVYGQGNETIFVKTKSDCTLSEGKIFLSLTQEETFSVSPAKLVWVEIRIKLVNGKVVKTEKPIILRVIDTKDAEVM